MATFADAGAAVEHLVELDDRGRLPFTWYRMGPRRRRVDVAVAEQDLRVALEYFAEHPMRRPGGEPIAVDVRVLAGASWVSGPAAGAPSPPDRAALDGMLGMDVHEAAQRANAAGWVVRAHEPGAVLTAELRSDRVDLEYSRTGTVVSVHVG